MFSFLSSETKKMRQNAKNWLEVADRVFKFRRDHLTVEQTRKLLAATGEVKARLKDRAEEKQLKPAVETLEAALGEVGGRIYPVSSMVENVEFFLVAAIVILGLRAYLVQPFKIPTNSMWPSYYGMKASELYKPGEEPGLLRKAVRLLTLGATNYSATASADGEVMIPVFATSYDGTHFSLKPAYVEKAGRSLFIFPTTVREYTFSVGGEKSHIAVPAEFDNEFQDVLDDAFKGDSASLIQALRAGASKNKPLESSTMSMQGREVTIYWVPIGKMVHRGEKIISFDILTGDLLFVDRLTYNFFQPKVGQGFVFKTENIRNRNMQDAAGQQIQQYYIKRLVGTPGDTLEIKPPVLWLNGKPIEGSSAFQKNASREGLYPGYTYANDRYGIELLTGPGVTYKVPAKSYFAMGDNSPRSQDSRYWGIVPDKDVVGRPLFIYYPLTSRWGPAR
jgi:signal peptidase I